MLDRPLSRESTLKLIQVPVSNSMIKGQARQQEPGAEPKRAGWHHGGARPFVQLRKSGSVGHMRRRIGAGLGALAVVAALGLTAARHV